MTAETERQVWMATLASSELNKLEELVSKLGVIPKYTFLRSPETGLTMVRGRVGGTGEQFNLGEITMTRCVVRLENLSGLEATTGFGYVTGRSRRHSELAALCDALLQSSDWYRKIKQEVIEPLQDISKQQQEVKQSQTAATKVNFFTLIRGEG